MPNISLYDLGAKNIFFRMHGKIGIKNYGHIQFICNSNSRMSRKPIWSIIDQHTKPNHFFNFFRILRDHSNITSSKDWVGGVSEIITLFHKIWLVYC